MPKSRPQLASRQLVVHRLDSSLPFGELTATLGSRLEARPDLGLFLDDGQPGLARVGGIDLRGDMLIRPETPGNDRHLLVACRQGDIGTLESMLAVTGGCWRRSRRTGSNREGLTLLDFLQSDAVVACLDRVRFAERALEDAFSCRFAAVDELRREIVRMHSRALLPLRMMDLLEEYGPCKIHLENLWAPSVILHEGQKLPLLHRAEVHSRGRVLTLHHSYHAPTRACVIGAMTERRGR